MGGFNVGGAAGGAMSGAQMGSSIYPGWGTAIGAGLGAIGGGMGDQSQGAGSIQGSPAQPGPTDLGNSMVPPSSFAPTSVPSLLGQPGRPSDAVREHLLRQLRGER